MNNFTPFSKLPGRLLIVLCCFFVVNSYAQPTYYTPGGSSNNAFPFNNASSNRVQWVYAPTEFNSTLPGGTITHVYFRTSNSTSTTRTFDSLRISIKHVSYSTFASAAWETGLTVCYGPVTTTIAIPSTGWFGVQLSTPFVYNGTSNLVIEATVSATNGTTVNQNSTNGTKRVWGGRWSTTATNSGSGQAACGLEVMTCPVVINTQPEDSVACVGGNASFSIAATSTNTYQWQLSTNGGASWANVTNTGVYNGATTNTLIITGVTTGMSTYMYRCVASNTANACSVTTNHAILTVNQPPAILTTTPGAACTGTPGQVSATASAGATVQWYNQSTGGTLLGTGNTLNIASAPATNTTYYAYPNVTNTTCTATVRTGVQLIVNNPPAITSNPNNSTICGNGNTMFTIAASGASSYQWELSTNGGVSWNNVNNGGMYSGATTTTLNISGAPPPMSGYRYRCKASCTSTATSNHATLTVNAPPAISTQPADKTICSGANTSFGCVATGAGPLSYQWEISTDGGSNWTSVINGGIYSNATTATLDITGATVINNGFRFRCVVSGACTPPATTSEGILTVNTLPNVTADPTSKADCPGASVFFNCTAVGTGISYQWQEFTTVWNNLSNGGGYAGATTNTLTISNINASQDGRLYRCVISGTCTPADTTDTAVLTVHPSPNVAASSNTPVCEENSLQLNSTSTTTGVTYSWTGPNSFSATIQNPSIASPVVAHTGDFVVTATVTATGCSAQATTPVVVKIKPSKPTLTSNSAVCTGYNIELTSNSTTGASYSWTGPLNYSSNQQNPIRVNASNNMEGYYKVVANINGCPSHPDSIFVDIVPSPSIGAFPSSPGAKICSGETIYFFGVSANTGTNPTYQWMKNNVAIAGADSLKYSSSTLVAGDVIKLRMTPGSDVSCNNDIFSVDMPIVVLPYLPPSVVITMEPSTHIWPGLMVTFTANTTDAGKNPRYQWKVNGQDIQGATGKTWATTELGNNDIVTCSIISNYDCPQPLSGNSNAITVPVRVSIGNVKGMGAITLFPNPNHGSFTIKGKITSGKVKAEIINAVGQVVYTKEITVTGGSLNEEVSAGNLADGIYMLRLSAGEEQSSLRFRIAN